MIATLVFVNVIPEFTAEFEKITEYNHINSRKEEGNVRFDVLHDNNDPNKYVLYEVYRDKEAAAGSQGDRTLQKVEGSRSSDDGDPEKLHTHNAALL